MSTRKHTGTTYFLFTTNSIRFFELQDFSLVLTLHKAGFQTLDGLIFNWPFDKRIPGKLVDFALECALHRHKQNLNPETASQHNLAQFSA